MKTLVIFDVGGVLVKLNSMAMFEELANHTPLSAEQIKLRLAKSGVEKDLNAGNPHIFYNEIRTILSTNISDDEIIRARRLMLPDQVKEMVALKRKLHEAGHLIGILSTIDDATRRFIDEVWPEMLETWSGPREFSYKRKLLKPDPAVYRPFVGLAENIIYIEDKIAYLKYPVEQLGWIGIHLTSFQDMNEPIRHVDPMHHHAEVERGTWHEAHTPADVESILKEHGLEF